MRCKTWKYCLALLGMILLFSAISITYTKSEAMACEHNFQTTYIPASCTNGGYYLVVCPLCGMGYQNSDGTAALGHNTDYYESPDHTPGKGHYYKSYCSRCGMIYSDGYKTESTCLSCTTPPSVSFSNKDGDIVLSYQNASFCPNIKVFDNENDTLTCNYYLDGSTTPSGTMTVTGTKPEKVATFSTPINVLNLPDGTHTIRATVTDYLAPTGEASLAFIVDKSAPTISKVNTETTALSAKLTVSATDTTGLSSNAYRFTINGITSEWLSTNYYNIDKLTPGTNYNYRVEVKDKGGNIAVTDSSFFTNMEKPIVSAVALSENGLRINIKDNNPALTKYRIKIGNGYVDSNNTVTSSEKWITLENNPTYGEKTVNLSKLSSNMEYTIAVTAQNSANGELAVSNSVSVITSPCTPTNLTVNANSNSSILISWDASPGAISYELYRETISETGTILASKTFSNIIANKYLDIDMGKYQTYRYKVRSMNQSGICSSWSDFVMGSTIPEPLAKVTGINAEADGSILNITWDAMEDAVGYEVEVVYDGNIWRKYFTTNNTTLDTGILNCQCNVSIRAFNICNENDKTNSTYWKNAGEWSDSKIFYTKVNVPVANEIDSAKITPHSIELHWSADGNPDSVQYKIGIYKNGILVNETEYTTELVNLITGLDQETAYSFKVKARNNALIETEWSNEVYATTLIDYPSVPSGLRATSKTDRIILAWNPSDRVQSYQIERNGIVIATDYSDNTYTDENLTEDTKYSYRVNAANSTGESGWSYVLETRTLSNLPDKPSITSVSGSSVNAVITWAPSDRTDSYEIEVDGDVYNTGTDMNYEHNGLLPSSIHTYRVRGRNGFGAGVWSDPYTIKTTPAIPDVPNNVSVATTDKQISVHWDAVDNTDSYDVEVNGEVFNQITASEYLYTVDGETVPDTLYNIRVRAVNQGGVSEWSITSQAALKKMGEGDIPVISIPSTPEPICSVSGASIVMINWDKSQDATVYQIEADGTIIYTGANTYFAHTGLGEKTAHQYRVRAGNSSGFSEWSNTIRIVTNAVDAYSPQNLNYYRNDDGKTTILWDSVPEAFGYCIELNGIQLEGAINGTEADISTVPGEVYSVRVACIRNIGSKQKYNWSEIITFRAPRNLPAAPVISKVTATSDSIKAEWSPVADVYGYEVEIDGQVYDNGSGLSCLKTNLKASTSYNIRIRAYNESGESKWSESKTIMTDQGIPGVPVNITGESVASVDTVSGSAIKLQWDGLEGTSSYEVEDSHGNISTTNTNNIVVNNLVPGQKYDYRVRAVSNAGAGAWSSKISFTPAVTAPTNVVIQVADGKVRLSWDKVPGINQYEVEIDGIIYTTTELTSIDFENSLFYTQRKICVRACCGDQKSEWSQEVTFNKILPITFDTYTGETLSVVLPVKNAKISKYTLSLQYSTDEMELIDACELTPEMETSSTYIEDLKTYIVIEKNGTKGSITFVVDGNENMNWSGIASSIRFQSKKSGTITVTYSANMK